MLKKHGVDPSEQRPPLKIRTDDLKPAFTNYRNPQDDKVQLALQEAEKRLRAQGKPLVLAAMKDSK